MGQDEGQCQGDLAERISMMQLQALELGTIWLGDRLGLYAALAKLADATPGELAEVAGIAERYACEWLEQQAVMEILDVSVPDADSAARRYRLPPGHAEVLLDQRSLQYRTPDALDTIATLHEVAEVQAAFRSGGGVSFSRYGEGVEDTIGQSNRPIFEHRLVQHWLPAMPEVVDRLNTGIRVADVGCGAGWAAITLGAAFPATRVDGFDPDQASIEQARGNATAAGVGDRVAFHNSSADQLTGPYDLITAFECVHDMADPVGVLTAARSQLAAGGVMLVADERVADDFTAPGDVNERLHYAFSVLQCLPASMASTPSAALGTVLRVDTMRALVKAAGFAECVVLPVEEPGLRLYLLRP